MTLERTRWLAVFCVAVLAFGIVAAACGDDDANVADPVATPGAGDDPNLPSLDEDENPGPISQEITIKALPALRFEPDEMTVTAGERVQIVLQNEDETTRHDFTVQDMPAREVASQGAEHNMEGMAEQEVHVAAAPGESATLTFTPIEPGEYEFICTVDGHEAAGMTGTLVVEEG
jgi:uncharacterized cupredoxin-like copper-binding protein